MIIDFLILAAIGGGFYFGFKKGVLYSLLTFLGVFVGFMIALKFSTMVAVFLADVVDINPKILPPLAFILLFIGLVLSFKLMAWVLEGALKLVMLNFFNKLAGGLLWAIMSLLIISACLWYLNAWDIIPSKATETSMLFDQVMPITPILTDRIGLMIPLFEGMFDTFESLLEEIV